ncbi:endonuclease/exonuclease/phosphatase family protein [Galactobacter sp.]|uniref:endonuclease/exonuclease/phosphatase family protein n=1 Tax=Galactobacter sp. TaxID=2676125 RepID=UPI0025BBB74A|nr:endonuclease/exonuclease/phosphatase family protein [Galactobacter sp.]
MFLRRALPGVIAAAGLMLAGAAVPAHAVEPTQHVDAARTTALDTGTASSQGVSVATLNAGLTSKADGQTLGDLQAGGDERAEKLARTVAQERPDVLVLTGIDVDPEGDTIEVLKDQYLNAAGGSAYRYVYAPATNAGVDSGADLDGDGTIGGAGDALGAGDFPGQASMAVLSVHPIDRTAARTFSKLTWAEAPGNHLNASDVPTEARKDIPLFSTSLWDVPVEVEGDTLHIVATSLSPASGDGTDAARNRDQVQLIHDYVTGGANLSSVEDDQGRPGPLSSDTPAVVAGDLGVDISSNAPAAKTVKSLLRMEDVELDAGTSENWLVRLERLLKDSAAATRVGTSSSRLDYVIGAGELQNSESDTKDAVRAGGSTHRMVVADFDL